MKLGTWELVNLETWELGNMETWELGNLGSWKLGTWEIGNLGTWELATSQDRKNHATSLDKRKSCNFLGHARQVTESMKINQPI